MAAAPPSPPRELQLYLDAFREKAASVFAGSRSLEQTRAHDKATNDASAALYQALKTRPDAAEVIAEATRRMKSIMMSERRKAFVRVVVRMAQLSKGPPPDMPAAAIVKLRIEFRAIMQTVFKFFHTFKTELSPEDYRKVKVWYRDLQKAVHTGVSFMFRRAPRVLYDEAEHPTPYGVLVNPDEGEFVEGFVGRRIVHGGSELRGGKVMIPHIINTQDGAIMLRLTAEDSREADSLPPWADPPPTAEDIAAANALRLQQRRIVDLRENIFARTKEGGEIYDLLPRLHEIFRENAQHTRIFRWLMRMEEFFETNQERRRIEAPSFLYPELDASIGRDATGDPIAYIDRESIKFRAATGTPSANGTWYDLFDNIGRTRLRVFVAEGEVETPPSLSRPGIRFGPWPREAQEEEFVVREREREREEEEREREREREEEEYEDLGDEGEREEEEFEEEEDEESMPEEESMPVPMPSKRFRPSTADEDEDEDVD